MMVADINDYLADIADPSQFKRQLCRWAIKRINDETQAGLTAEQLLLLGGGLADQIDQYLDEYLALLEQK